MLQTSSPPLPATPSEVTEAGMASSQAPTSALGAIAAFFAPKQQAQLGSCSSSMVTQPAASPFFKPPESLNSEAVEVHRLGMFKFKGNPEPIELVHITLAALAARRYPSEPPKGKGNRLEARSGLVATATVALPDVPEAVTVALVEPSMGSVSALRIGSFGNLRSISSVALRNISSITSRHTTHPKSSSRWAPTVLEQGEGRDDSESSLAAKRAKQEVHTSTEMAKQPSQQRRPQVAVDQAAEKKQDQKPAPPASKPAGR
jgi:hypothetical protein